MNSAQYPDFVAALAKQGAAVREGLTDHSTDLLHAAVGICGEAGELLDAIKKHAVYGKPIDMGNVIEELGDLEFYMQQLRNAIGVPREFCILQNVRKLEKRYSTGVYSDAQAQARADKARHDHTLD